MSVTIMPEADLEAILDELDELGLQELRTLVTTARSLIQTRTGVKLAASGDARQQLRADATQLNALISKRRALDAWLEVATLQVAPGRHAPIVEARRKAFDVDGAPLVGSLEIPERIIVKDEMVAFDWLVRAVEVAGAIAWVGVPRFRNGQRDAGQAHGTALLIDKRHILTCMHVFKARNLGEDPPDAADLALQIAGSSVAFGFVAGEAPNITIKVKGHVASNEKLDYAVVELADEVVVPVPTLWLGALPEIKGDRAFVVNILQHPRGEFRRLAMRNNAVALVEDDKIGYWTDTDHGSSGAPVFDDEWRVIAIHRAYETRSGLKSYLGRSIGGANVGSRITRIVEDLRGKVPDLVKRLELLGP